MKNSVLVLGVFTIAVLASAFMYFDLSDSKYNIMEKKQMNQAPVSQPRENFVKNTDAEVADTDDIDDFIDTEGTGLPEIIIDEEAFANLPKNEQGEVSFNDIDEASGDLEDISVQKAVRKEVLPESINLDIPFYAQAPEGDRSLPWKEACEESSIILAAYFMNNESLSLPEFKQEVYALVDLQNELFGKYIDTSVAETKELFDAYYGIGRTEIIDNPTIDEIKYHLAQGHPIVAPFAGKLLGNTNFTNGGPRYHMLVIKGYDTQYFYTNDVGTKRGKDFPYTYEVIMNSLHDLVPVGEGEITQGEKRILVLTK